MYKGFRFPREIISHCVWLYQRFSLWYREIELLMAERGVDVTYETIRPWCTRFGSECARRLRRGASRPGDTWHLDEVFVTIGGVRKYLWRAVDQQGNGRRQVVWGAAVFGCRKPSQRAVGQAAAVCSVT